MKDEIECNMQKEYIYKQYSNTSVQFIFNNISEHMKTDNTYLEKIKEIDYELFLKYREEILSALKKNKLNTAKQLIDEEYKIYSEDPAMLFLQSEYFLRRNDKANALKGLSKAIEIAPDNLELRYYRANVFAKLGDRQAISDYDYIYSHFKLDNAWIYFISEQYLRFNQEKKARELLLQLYRAKYKTAKVNECLLRILRRLEIKVQNNREDIKLKEELNQFYKEMGIGKIGQKLRKLIIFSYKKTFILIAGCICIQLAIIYVSLRSCNREFSFENIYNYFIGRNQPDSDVYYSLSYINVIFELIVLVAGTYVIIRIAQLLKDRFLGGNKKGIRH